MNSKPKKTGNITDKPNGRPQSASNESNVAAVAKLVKEDPHICIRVVSAKSFSFGSWLQNGHHIKSTNNEK